jgi:hypothetical protein
MNSVGMFCTMFKFFIELAFSEKNINLDLSCL